ncbi:uncharacterized protein TNCV_4849841 [Trichonephila clavipes]|nr:uncharacterized protein TNCV_4849841 [Trichonephila clavipes]
MMELRASWTRENNSTRQQERIISIQQKKTTQLVSRNKTTQLCTAVDRLQPPATAFTEESAFSTYSCLIQRDKISNVTFMQDGATSHTANPVKAFLIQMFGEDRIVSRYCRYLWSPRFPDLTPAEFWLWGYLKSRVFLSDPSRLWELKDAIHREVSSIHTDMLHSAIAGFATRLECLLPCGGGHVEHILV